MRWIAGRVVVLVANRDVGNDIHIIHLRPQLGRQTPHDYATGDRTDPYDVEARPFVIVSEERRVHMLPPSYGMNGWLVTVKQVK